MFKIAVNECYLTPVQVEVPDGTGKSIKTSFKAKFKRLKQGELDELQRRLDRALLAEGEERITDEQVLQDVLVGWEGVQDQDGNEVEFNAENMAALLDIYPVRPTLVVAYFDSIKTGKRKN